MSRGGIIDTAPDLFTRLDVRRTSNYPDDIPAEVCDLFEDLALKVHRKGWGRYSADALLHQIRWHEHIERGNREFKANNNWTSTLARWFITRHANMAGFFELRASPQTQTETADQMGSK